MNRLQAGSSEQTPRPQPPRSRVAGFRTKLLVVMMLVVSGVTLLALYFAQRRLAADVADDLQREFQGELAALHKAREIRHAGLVERCRTLVRKPRIQAALLDGGLDLLYLNAEDELRDMIARPAGPPTDRAAGVLRAQFYRFLDRDGDVIAPVDARAIGDLVEFEVERIELPAAPEMPQIGYIERAELSGGSGAVSEIIAMPIISMETGEVIAALVLGFEPFELREGDVPEGMKRGIWFDGRLHSRLLAGKLDATLGLDLEQAIAAPARSDAPTRIEIDGMPHLLFSKQLNPDSLYPPAFEVCVYPLSGLLTRQRQLRWQVLGAGTLLLLIGLAASHVASTRLSAPVEKLAVDSEEDRTQRRRAEAALESTSAELQRSARFSADASHQLKTPVTVLRAGLEELLAREHLTPEECHEVSALIHQTYRLSSLIEDLLLLSRMDAGRLKLELSAVDLSQLIEASLDDLSASPDEWSLTVETDFPRDLHIVGEKRYTAMILQNLLENARKYNRPAGRIRIAAHLEDDTVRVVIGNTGRPISAAAQEHIFERFHRGTIGENVPGYGLGLNLARELARLHQGDLRLVRSDEHWTEFEVRFRLKSVAVVASGGET